MDCRTAAEINRDYSKQNEVLSQADDIQLWLNEKNIIGMNPFRLQT